MFLRQLKWTLGAGVLATTAMSLHAQMAQDPLLSRTAAVEPNIVFMFDDSASMVSTAIYQYGTSLTGGYQGTRGPNNDAECLPQLGSGCVWGASPPPAPYGQSPDVNLIYYDPRVKYDSRVKADGTFYPVTSLPATTAFSVFFYKGETGTTRFSVVKGPLTITSGGTYASATPPTLTFTADAGAVAATASATLAPLVQVPGVSPPSGGSYVTNPNGLPVAFGAPASGTTATGTVIAGGRITAVTNPSNLRFGNTVPNGTCSTAITPVAPPAIPGTGASVTAVLSGNGNRAPTFSALVPGNGYPAGTTFDVTCGGVKNVYPVTIGGPYTVTGVTMVNKGSGYTANVAPSLTYPTASGGTTATGSALPAVITSYYVNSARVDTTGSGYASCPTLSISGNATFTQPTCIESGNKKWDGKLNPNGLAVGKGPISYGDYFNPYTPDGSSPLAATATVLPYPTVTSSITAAYPKFKARTDCVGSVCTFAEELQNYSIWKLYHSTRIELAKTGVGAAFQPLNPTFRLGWGTLGGISGLGSTGSQCGAGAAAQLTSGVRLFDNTVQAAFLSWLYGLSANVLCTPSRFALNNVGRYYQRADDAGPWGSTPTGNGSITQVGATNDGHATCRRAYSMLMTDGYYNDNAAGFTLGGTTDYDSTSRTVTTNPRTFAYTPIGPYSDNINSGTKYSDTLADVAMKYWVTDLRPTLDNNINPVSTDDAYWQHMNFYAIGLGLIGSIDATDPLVLKSLSGNSPARTRNWPSAPAPDDPKAIDDMWHATVNGRGKMLNAKTAAELNDSIRHMMAAIGAVEGTQSGVAVSTISLNTDTRKYTPKYTPVTWTGNVVAWNLDQLTAVQTTIAWQAETLISTDTVTGAKTYATPSPTPANRSIFVGNGATSGTTRANDFKLASMTTAELTALGGGASSQLLIDYLRGDKTNEDNNTTVGSPSAIYRPRETRLGDIVNSTPAFVKNSIDLKYEALESATQSPAIYGGIWDTYRDFIIAKNKRPEGVLFVGANDGMLHGFRDGTYQPGTDIPIIPGGTEIFAYVPNALLPSLRKLSDKTYVHQYYVDGPITETDAYFKTRTPGWHNLILGSTGAGAGTPPSPGVSPRTAVFAIDTTSLNNTTTLAMDASNVLWEVSSSMTNFGELGYVLTDVQAGVTVGGRWIAVFGNGYESASCKASLFVVDLETGAWIKEISTGVGSCVTGSKNGLGGVRLVKDAYNQVVGAYAGDLLGNMWKFNLNNALDTGWGLDLNGKPLFTSATGQPITAPPTSLTLPIRGTTAPAAPGQMVIFGTGKFFEVSDISTNATQSLYGIWDKFDFGAPSASIPALYQLTGTSTLVRQTISGPQQPIAGGNTYFGVSNNTIDYSAGSTKRGWFIDLPNSGQRTVYPLDLLAKRFIVADTISPANVSTDPCINGSAGTGYLYVIDSLNGGGPSLAVLDTNGDGSVTNPADGGVRTSAYDLVVSGIQTPADGRNVSIVVKDNDLESIFANVGGGSPGATLININCALTNSCKTTAPTVRHQWRQLFLR